MDSFKDKAYVVAELRCPRDFEFFKKAVCIVAAAGNLAPIDWHRMRLELDRTLPGITEPQAAFFRGAAFVFGVNESGGYPAFFRAGSDACVR